MLTVISLTKIEHPVQRRVASHSGVSAHDPDLLFANSEANLAASFSSMAFEVTH